MVSTVLSFMLYVIQSIRPLNGVFSILQLYIGMIFAISLCMLVIRNEEKLPNIKIVKIIASVTLESYLVQFISRDAYSAIGFPTNIIYHVISTIAVAFCLHYISGKVCAFIDTLLLGKNKL